MKFFYCLLGLVYSATIHAQSVGLGTLTPDSRAALEVSANNRGFLMPRLTVADRDGILHPATGLQIYNSTHNRIAFFDGVRWSALLDSAGSSGSGNTISLPNKSVR